MRDIIYERGPRSTDAEIIVAFRSEAVKKSNGIPKLGLFCPLTLPKPWFSAGKRELLWGTFDFFTTSPRKMRLSRSERQQCDSY